MVQYISLHVIICLSTETPNKWDFEPVIQMAFYDVDICPLGVT